jgi:NAD-dependent deacetylase
MLSSLVVSDPLSRLVDVLADPNRSLLVVTGAGVSLASGIPTFRGSDPGAVWKRETTEIGTAEYLERDPVGWWRWVLTLRDTVLDAEPNAAHHALAALEEWHGGRSGGGFLLVTQNIDLLHERAGSRLLVKVHGTADRLRCSVFGCEHGAPAGSLLASDFDLERLRREPCVEHLPRCPRCRAVVRGHVLLFDEYYDEHRDYQFDRVRLELEQMDVVLFVGTSFSVGVTELALRAAWARRLPAFSVDPGGHPAPLGPQIVRVDEPAEEALPRLCRQLGIPVERAERGTRASHGQA